MWKTEVREAIIPSHYALLKHLFDPSIDVKAEPSILSLLSAGRIPEACDIAIRRMRASGYKPILAAYGLDCDGIRLAASLLIPIHSISRLSARVLSPQKQDER